MFLFSHPFLLSLVICLELTLSDDEDLHIFEYINRKLSYKVIKHKESGNFFLSPYRLPYDFSSNLFEPETIAGSSEVPHLAMTATKWTLECTEVLLRALISVLSSFPRCRARG